MRTVTGILVLLACLSVRGGADQAGRTGEWARFRGPNGSGVSTAANVPVEFSPTKNLQWRLPLPSGHSSPILLGDRIYLTAHRADALFTIAIDRRSGKILWERQAPAVKTTVVDKRNNPASPSPAVEADGIYVFFPDYGMLAYDASGKERWRMPLGPFNNIYGMGASPVIVGDLVVLACDQSTGSFLLAVDKKTGQQKWRTLRPEAKSGHSTPILWRAPDGKDEILLPGSFLLTGYDPQTGAKKWWVRGLSFEMKSTPVISDGVLFINGYGAPDNDPGRTVKVPPADEVWKTADANADGLMQKTEFPKYSAAFWFGVADLDGNGTLSKEEWEYYRAAIASENGLLAIRLGGKGDMTDTAIVWKYQRAVPQLPSPLLYRNVLYMVNDGGIVTTINPKDGTVIKQGRLGPAEHYYASPVAADGHVYFVSEEGKVAVLPPDGDLTPIVVNVLGENCYATPAFADGRLYIRTTDALYSFGS
ncbi:MAG TPA: PQQ-binding-like beta-propeller repeat protein [Vicinamibacterales bacterium]|jgi:outer membrane protein assembly factor BamB